jgi:hypothetical protein
MDATLAIEPIWFRSLASADDPSWSFYGLAAEDVAEIDPRLVNWGYRQEDYTLVIRQQGKQDEYGEYVRNPDAKLVPDGVQYDRVAILQIAALKARIEALEQRL